MADQARVVLRHIILLLCFWLPAGRRKKIERWLRGSEEFAKLQRCDWVLMSWGKSGRTWLRVMLSRAYQLKVLALLAKGDKAGAEAAIAALAKYDPVRGAMARAELLRADKKPAEAAKELQGIWGTAIKPGDEPASEDAPTYASVGFLLAGDLAAGGQVPAANETWRKLAFSPMDKGDQAKAHLALAKALGEGSDKAQLQAAIDHAFMAAGLASSERMAAKRLAQAIIVKLEKDAGLKDEIAEYRVYLNQL